MSLVPSLLQAIVHVDGEALVLHAGDKPYVVAPAGQIELASSALALDAVSGIVAQLLPPESLHALDEFGAVQYELPPQPGFPRERFTVVAARGGDDVWAEIRRRRVLEENFLDEALAAPLPEASPAAPAGPAPEPQGQPAAVLVEEVAGATARLDDITRRLTALDDRTKGLDEIDKRIQALTEAARQAEQATLKALGPDGELKAHGEAVQHLSSEVLRTQATLEELKKERGALEELRGHLRDAEREGRQTLAQAGALKNELGQIRSSTTALTQDADRIREALREADEGIGIRKETAALLETFRAELGTLAARQQELETFDERVRTLQEAVTDSDGRIEALAAKDRDLVALSEKVDGIGSRFDTVLAQLGDVAKKQIALESLDDRLAHVDELLKKTAVAAGAHELEAKMDLQEQHEVVRHLSSEAQATLEALKNERAGLEELRGHLRDAEQGFKQAMAQVGALKNELDQKLAPLSQLNDLTQAAEGRLGSLNALAEQVSHRVKDLEAQHQAVEQAVVQANRVTETISAMGVQVDKLTEDIKQAAKAEETIARIEQLSARSAERMEAAAAVSQEVERESARLQKDSTALLEVVRAEMGMLGARMKEIEAFDERVRTLQRAVTESEGTRRGAGAAEIEAKLEAILGRMVLVEKATQRATRLDEVITAPAAQAQPAPFEGERTGRPPADEDLALPDKAQLWQDANARGASFEDKHVSRPAADDDLALPDADQLWSERGRGGVLSGGEGLEVELPDGDTRRVGAGRTQPPGATIRLEPPDRPVPPPTPPAPAAAVEPPPVRPAPQPAVILPMSRNPIRADRTEAPPPADDTLWGLERLLRIAAARGASTLYLSSDARPSIRVDGQIQILDGEPVLASHDVVSLLLTLMPERSHEALRKGATTEWLCDIEAIGRVRCMSVRDHRGPGGVFRLMPGQAVSVDQLGLSPEIEALAIEPEGLVLIAGPRSSGKRTLISALVDLINRTRHDHVITIEREINIAHVRGSSFVSQREVRGGDEELLAAARAALREDPDVLVLEQIRNGALMNVALEAAASGHLVIGGFAAHDATETIDRIIDLYAPEYSRQVQFALADNLRGVVAQVLLPKIGGGRVAARELLLNTPAGASVLAEGTTSHLPMAIEGGRRHGMVPLNDALVSLVLGGLVDVREACRHVADRPVFLALLKRHGIDTSAVERLA